tara:strand:- start:623 stop:1372 length:750 start_codon:yes stop_codon:yes gene_type:complete
MSTLSLSESQLREIIISEKRRFEKDIRSVRIIRESLISQGLWDKPITSNEDIAILNEFVSGAMSHVVDGASQVISKTIAQYFLEYLGVNTQSLFGNLLAEVFENAPVISFWLGRATCDELSTGIGKAVGDTFSEPLINGVIGHLGIDTGNMFYNVFREAIQDDFIEGITAPLADAIQSVLCVITLRDAAGIATGGVIGSDPSDVRIKIERAAESQVPRREREEASSGESSESEVESAASIRNRSGRYSP